MRKLPAMTKPCVNCPFRKDCTPNWLGKKRMTEILDSSSFVCHKTTNSQKVERKQCAGFMIIKKDESQFVKLAQALNQELKLTGQELVFDSKQGCINHHKFISE